MVVGRLLSYCEGNFSGAMLNFWGGTPFFKRTPLTNGKQGNLPSSLGCQGFCQVLPSLPSHSQQFRGDEGWLWDHFFTHYQRYFVYIITFARGFLHCLSQRALKDALKKVQMHWGSVCPTKTRSLLGSTNSCYQLFTWNPSPWGNDPI